MLTASSLTKVYRLGLALALVLAFGLAGCSSSDDDGGTEPTIDTTAPNPVTDLLVLPGDGEVSLSWINPYDSDLAGVRIRRATDAAPTATTGEVVYEGMATSYVDQSAANDTEYYYGVFAYDAAGNVSAGVVKTCTPHVGAPVVFADANLEQLLRIELGVPSGDITDLQMATLLQLDAGYKEIADLAGLQHAVNLTSLDLAGNNLTDDSNVQLIAGFTNLEALDLGANAVTILPNLGDLEHLRTLNLTGNPILSFSPLSGLTQLETLYFGECDIADLTPLASLTGLVYLGFHDCEVTDLSPLYSLPNLSSLHVAGCPIASITGLSGLSSLERLGLTNCGLTDVTPLGSMTGLVTLSLGGNEIQDISPLAALTGLTILMVDTNEIDDISPVAGLTGLETLTIGWNPVRDISMLGGLTALDFFHAYTTYVSDISVLTGLDKLVTVGLGSSPLNTEAVTTDIPALEAGGATVDFGYEAKYLQLMGTWTIGSITMNGAAVDPGDFFDWDASTVTNRLIVYPYGDYESADLSADGSVQYTESGHMEVDGDQVSVVAYVMDDVTLDPHETVFTGTWSKNGTDLIFTTIDGGDTVVMTWIR